MDRLFDFHLRPLDEILSRAKPTETPISLSWYKLTDGFYRMQVGDEFLLNLTPEMLAHWAKQYPTIRSTLVDYHVVRLWEDILAMLPRILSPLPDELINYFKSHNLSFFSFCTAADKWLDQFDATDDGFPEWDIFVLATSWLSHGNQRLDVAFLRFNPYIWLWSHADTVTVTWDTREKEDGVQVWSAQSGSFSMSRAQFLDHTHQFHNELISQMEERVADICNRRNLPGIIIDGPDLPRQHEERAKALQAALTTAPPQVDWGKVLDAIREIRK